MAIGDDGMLEESAFSFGTDTGKLEQVGTVISSEDIAWADSCLAKDSEELEGSWNSMKEALLETLTPERDASADSEDNLEMSSSINKGKLSDVSSRAGELIEDVNGDFWSRYDPKDVFLPAYNERMRQVRSTGSAEIVETNSEDGDMIFKTWDLDVPVEEEELMQELSNGVLEWAWEGKVEGEGKGLEVDDLIADIGDLSL
ncbi:uncharacterized protein LOC127252658 [Andrographis paniculata]|uniref:uncharacterized protein LOC127252658 n=1 Tax=Andrographis paniculata TaxID=175694 RepID=UPI0021E887EE|nr:uncharacterized protein LOC127252658 [Andrographis paniculata]